MQLSTSPAEVKLVPQVVEERFVADVPERLIGDKAYDSDRLDEQMLALGGDRDDRTAPLQPANRPQNPRWPAVAAVPAPLESRADVFLALQLPPPRGALGISRRKLSGPFASGLCCDSPQTFMRWPLVD